MPKRYVQIVNSIETLLDFDQLTLEDVTGQHKSVQDRKQAPDSDSIVVGGKLLYTAEQWRAFEEEEGARASKDRCRRPGGGKKTSRAEIAAAAALVEDHRRPRQEALTVTVGRTTMTSASTATTPTTGHECPHPRRNRDCGRAAHVAEAEEDAALFFTHGSIELDTEEGYDKVQASSFCSKHTSLDFEEPRARAYLDTRSDDAEKMDGCYLDSSATYHMT
jgi:hypothetical protein